MEDYMQKPPQAIDGKILNRIAGSMLGLALGSVAGARLELQPDDNSRSDETQMVLCLASSLIVSEVFNLYDQLVRYKWGYRHGYMSSTGRRLETESATRQCIEDFERKQRAFAEQHDIHLADIESLSDPQLLGQFDVYYREDRSIHIHSSDPLVRLASIPLFFFHHPSIAIEYAGQSCRVTHADIQAIDACRYYAALIVAALHDYSKDELLDHQFYSKHRSWFKRLDLHQDIVRVAQGSYTTREHGTQGEVSIVQLLEAALWAFWSTNTFEEGVSAAMHMERGRSTIASIYGQLAGAYYGRTNLPDDWLDRLYAKRFISILSEWIVYEGQRWYSICLSDHLKNPKTQVCLHVRSTNTSDYTSLVQLMQGSDRVSRGNAEQAAHQIMHWVRRLPCHIEADGVEYIDHRDRYEIFLNRIRIAENIRKLSKDFPFTEIEQLDQYERKKMMERLGKFKRQIRHNLSESVTIVRGWYGCGHEEMLDITSDGFSRMIQLGPSANDRGFCFKSSAKAAAEEAESDGCVLMCYLILRDPFPTIIGHTSAALANNRYRFYSDGVHSLFQETTPIEITLPYHEIYYGFHDEFVTDHPDDVLPQVVVYVQRRSDWVTVDGGESQRIVE